MKESAICQNCGHQFKYNTYEAVGKFCSHSCFTQFAKSEQGRQWFVSIHSKPIASIICKKCGKILHNRTEFANHISNRIEFPFTKKRKPYPTCTKCGHKLLFKSMNGISISLIKTSFPLIRKVWSPKGRLALSSPERRLKISMANKGKRKPIEYRKRMSEIRRIDPRWQSEEAKQNARDKTIKQLLSFPNTNTSIELLLQESLASHNITFVTSKATGNICRPDIILLDRKVAIFADGCYWHGCTTDFPNPSPKQQYWIKRDNTHNKLLESEGWKIFRFWEHDIMSNVETTLKPFFDYIGNSVIVQDTLDALFRVGV